MIRPRRSPEAIFPRVSGQAVGIRTAGPRRLHEFSFVFFFFCYACQDDGKLVVFLLSLFNYIKRDTWSKLSRVSPFHFLFVVFLSFFFALSPTIMNIVSHQHNG